MKLKNNHYRLCILFLLFYLNIHSQSNTAVLKGNVKYNHSVIQDINVLNKNTSKGTSSDSKGNYSIKASLGDSLLFSSIIYENRIIKITNTHIKTKSITVYLEANYNLLQEVYLTKQRILNSIDIAVAKGTVLDNDKITDRKAPDARKLTDPNAGGSSIDFIGIYKLFTKKRRKRKKLEKIEFDKQEQLKKDFSETIIVRYKDSYFIESLHIQEHQINLFLDFCQSKGLNKLYDRNEIVIKNFLFRQAKHFNLLQNKSE